MLDIQNKFPRTFRVEQKKISSFGFVELSLYKVSEMMRWEGYYREQRISLYHNHYYWIVESFWRGEVRGYFRHYKEQIDLSDVEQLVQAACFLIDIFLEDKT